MAEGADEVPIADKKEAEQKYKEEEYENPENLKSNMRIEELSKPKKIRVQDIFTEYRKILPERNLKAIVLFLREEFAKSAEETEIDFNNIGHKQKVKICRNACRKEARIKHVASFAKYRRANMLNILTDILRRYITRAYFNPNQIIMTGRLRRISNVILKELCKIRNVPVPRRECTKIRALLMFATADFCAYCIDAIYYELQVMKVKDYEILKLNKENLTTPQSNEMDRRDST